MCSSVPPSTFWFFLSPFLAADPVFIVSLSTFWAMGALSNRKITLRILFPISTFLVFLLSPCLAGNVPANFVFGDSLVDAGNNNYIVSLSKANYIPNGIDFGKPTGRYTNGRTIVDIIGELCSFLLSLLLDSICHRFFELMGMLISFVLLLLNFLPPGQKVGFKDFTPPYLAPTTVGDVVLKGVNYASGGGGILNYTGKIFVRSLLFLIARF